MGDSITELSHQFGVSVAVVHVLQVLKNSNLPGTRWISKDSTILLRALSLAAALATSAGFKILSGDAQHGFTLFIPPVAIIIDTLIHAIAQYGAQQGYYSLVFSADQTLKKIEADMQPPVTPVTH